MIVKVRGKLYNSDEETICLMIPKNETKFIIHNYIEKPYSEMILVRNSTRDDSSSADMLLIQEEGRKFADEYSKKWYKDKKYEYEETKINLKKDGIEVT